MDHPQLLLLLILLPLSSGQITETLWHGSIFGWLRAGGSWAERKRGLLGALVSPLQVFTCPYCLSHWGAAIAVGLGVASIEFPVMLWVLTWLAVIRVSNFISDAWHPIRRSSERRSAVEVLAGITDEELEQEYIRRTGDPFAVGSVPPAPQQQGGPAGVQGGQDLQKEDYAPENVLGAGGIAGMPDQRGASAYQGPPSHPVK